MPGESEHEIHIITREIVDEVEEAERVVIGTRPVNQNGQQALQVERKPADEERNHNCH